MADSHHHMLLITFPSSSAARPAYEEAVDLPGLRQAAVLERSPEGLLDVPESHVAGAGVPTAGAGLAGGLIGLLGGPIGVFLGTAAGVALGNAAEEGWAREGGAGMIMLSSQVEDGAALLIVDLHESDPQPADDLARRHGGTLQRLTAQEFSARVRAAERAAG
ncbi:histidine kinase [Streptomyces sp. NPDC051563]|uniref:histidine kinase n=1 Tax=unclassified Streptomyces TaxID=2593676 RepID=UPI003798E0BC